MMFMVTLPPSVVGSRPASLMLQINWWPIKPRPENNRVRYSDTIMPAWHDT
jgi:hypothetical protein